MGFRVKDSGFDSPPRVGGIWGIWGLIMINLRVMKGVYRGIMEMTGNYYNGVIWGDI